MCSDLLRHSCCVTTALPCVYMAHIHNRQLREPIQRQQTGLLPCLQNLIVGAALRMWYGTHYGRYRTSQ